MTSSTPTTEVLTEKLTSTELHLKNVGAAVNFGARNGLVTVYKQMVAPWLVGVHCFSHRLELAAHNALRPQFSECDDFLREIYYHFKNSAKEWSLVLNLVQKLSYGVVMQPKSFGT